MKKKSVYGFMLVAFCFILVSCGNVFSKVQIKAKPSIYAPLGKEEFKMSTYVTVEKIEELLGAEKKIRISRLKFMIMTVIKIGL